jgi:hypothetical protein
MPTSRLAPQRRRHPRIEIDGSLTAQDLTSGSLVVIRDISAGGFRTESPRATAIGQVHTFRALLPGGERCVLQAAARHCQATTGARQMTLIGWSAEPDPVTQRALSRLIEIVTTVAPDVEGGVEPAVTTPVGGLRWPRG